MNQHKQALQWAAHYLASNENSSIIDRQIVAETSWSVVYKIEGMAQKPPVLVNIMRVEFYPDVLPFRHEYYDSIAL